MDRGNKKIFFASEASNDESNIHKPTIFCMKKICNYLLRENNTPRKHSKSLYMNKKLDEEKDHTRFSAKSCFSRKFIKISKKITTLD